MQQPPPPPPQTDTLTELLGSSRRDIVPIRKSFLQLRDDNGKPLPGPLATIVRRGVTSELNQLLLLHARAAGRPDGDVLNYDVRLPARVWARLLGLADDESGRRTVGRNWKALEDAGLVVTKRIGRQLRVTPLREDGSGEPYTRPKTKDDPYLRVPYAFWLDGHAAKLKLPGLALALIARSLVDWFALPFNKGPDWYGIGSSTVERGLRELRRASLLDMRFEWRATPLSETGWTKDQRYILLPPLGPLNKTGKNTPTSLLLLSELANPSLQADSDAEAPPAPQSSGERSVEQTAGGGGEQKGPACPIHRRVDDARLP
jgi:DNA-binding transcriptional ArsR family regulator